MPTPATRGVMPMSGPLMKREEYFAQERKAAGHELKYDKQDLAHETSVVGMCEVTRVIFCNKMCPRGQAEDVSFFECLFFFGDDEDIFVQRAHDRGVALLFPLLQLHRLFLNRFLRLQPFVFIMRHPCFQGV